MAHLPTGLCVHSIQIAPARRSRSGELGRHALIEIASTGSRGHSVAREALSLLSRVALNRIARTASG